MIKCCNSLSCLVWINFHILDCRLWSTTSILSNTFVFDLVAPIAFCLRALRGQRGPGFFLLWGQVTVTLYFYFYMYKWNCSDLLIGRQGGRQILPPTPKAIVALAILLHFAFNKTLFSLRFCLPSVLASLRYMKPSPVTAVFSWYIPINGALWH